jgi:hypothetical protein
MKTVSAGAMRAMTAPEDAWAMKSIAGLKLRATPAMASAWMATAIWKTPRVPKRAPILAPSRMNAAIAKVPAVMAVPTEVAGVSRSVVMPAIETVSALTAKDAWIWVSTTTISGSHEAFSTTDEADPEPDLCVLISQSFPSGRPGWLR